MPAKDAPLRPAYALGPTAAAGHAFERAFLLLAPHRPGAGRPARLPNRDQTLAVLARVAGRAAVFARARDVADGSLAKALGRRPPPAMAIDAAEVSRHRVRPPVPRSEQTQQPGY